ncbi:dUTP pyrophosphatase [Chroococcidiopsis sp. FACHB-1243]|uniref:dCTP deaminase n=1 Tax=Chroococcidiopsis sp. [FACHB-1243] TaxID=2692781 RepID=UPI0017870FC1|nr:dUTP pyrophosphatase [Chroococcidiopsis sp. [FACHB-1243]]MBD2304217.1 dUTP pyrophosphatase [Chroococcidiopsis sp. [FACHB-1243]]
MSFWSSQTLKSRLPGLIQPFNEAQVESASYQLCLGEEVYISTLPDTPLKDRQVISLKDAGTNIPPGQFAFLITAETVEVPHDAIAFISIKFKVKKHGLINVSGFHVDPGYKGKLIFAVYNAGPLHFRVKKGDRFFSIWYADLDEDDDKPYKGDGFNSIPSDFMNAPDLVSSIPNLVKRLDNVESKMENHKVQQAVYFSVVIAIGVALIPLVPSAITYLLDRYLPSNINNTQPAKTLSPPQPGYNPKEDSGKRK